MTKQDVVLIGNAPVETDHREWVDSAAFVVRFNVPRDTVSTTGLRCDALCISNNGCCARHFAKYRQIRSVPCLGPKTEIWFPRPWRRRAFTTLITMPIRSVRRRLDYSWQIVMRNGLQEQSIVYFSEAVWREAFEALSLDVKRREFEPSSGFLVLMYCLGRFPGAFYNIHLLGFTFQGLAHHPWDGERRAVMMLAESGAVKVDRLGMGIPSMANV